MKLKCVIVHVMTKVDNWKMKKKTYFFMINEKKEDYRESFVRTDAHEEELAQLSLCYPTDDDMDLDIIFPVVQNLRV